MSRVNGKTKNRVKGPHKELGERTNSRLKGQTKSNGHPQPFLAVNLHLSLPWWSTSSHLYPLVVFKKGVGWRGEKRRVMKEGRWNKEGYNLQANRIGLKVKHYIKKESIKQSQRRMQDQQQKMSHAWIRISLLDLHLLLQGWAPRSFPFGTFRSFPFFKRNIPFFSVLFSSFWRLMRPKRTQRTQHSFEKNGKERNVLLQRT